MGIYIMTRYKNDPYPLTLKYAGSCAACGCSLGKGSRAPSRWKLRQSESVPLHLGSLPESLYSPVLIPGQSAPEPMVALGPNPCRLFRCGCPFM